MGFPQWHLGTLAITYRCGGSTGIASVWDAHLFPVYLNRGIRLKHLQACVDLKWILLNPTLGRLEKDYSRLDLNRKFHLRLAP
jgi:hypothetical protein